MRIYFLNSKGLFIVGAIAFMTSYHFAKNATTGVEPVEWYIVASAFVGLLGMIMYLDLLTRYPEKEVEEDTKEVDEEKEKEA